MLHEVQQEVACQRSQPKVSLIGLLGDRMAQAQLHIGVTLQVLQQFCGINTVMYFTPLILQWAGFTDRRQALLWGCLPAACNAIGTVVGVPSFSPSFLPSTLM
jgi:MFS transporter, SP family, solute carrier family 2 (myo-inositol transporter), member 13